MVRVTNSGRNGVQHVEHIHSEHRSHDAHNTSVNAGCASVSDDYANDADHLHVRERLQPFMKHDDYMTWVLVGVGAYIIWQMYQSYAVTQATSLTVTNPLVSPVPQEGPVVMAGPPMTSVIN